MKEYLIIIAAIFFSETCNAQLIPNGGFENWTSIPGHPTIMEPDGWGTPNHTCIDSGYTPVVQRTADAHSGNWALKLLPFKRLSGQQTTVATVGTGRNKPGFYPSSLKHFYWNVPASYVPAKIGFYYKTYTPDNTLDGITVETSFYKSGIPDTLVAFKGEFLYPSSAFAYFESQLGYITLKDTFSIDSMKIIISYESYNDSLIPNNYIIFDDFSVQGNLSLHDVQLAKYIRLYPQPANEKLYITNIKLLQIKAYGIMSLNGQILQSTPWRGNEIDVASLPSGSYVLQLVTEKGIGSMKFVKQ